MGKSVVVFSHSGTTYNNNNQWMSLIDMALTKRTHSQVKHILSFHYTKIETGATSERVC